MGNSAKLMPWHQPTIREAITLHRLGRFPTTALFVSPDNIGVEHFLRELSASLLCLSLEKTSCGSCKCCQHFWAGTHGDFCLVHPAPDKKSIGIDQIRDAINFLQQTAAYGMTKVLVIKKADKLTVAAANALLKTLEEPQGNSVICLFSQRPWLLPATIRSRCQRWNLNHPSRNALLSLVSHCNIKVEPRNQDALDDPILLTRLVEQAVSGEKNTLGLILKEFEAVINRHHHWYLAAQATNGLTAELFLNNMLIAVETKLRKAETAGSRTLNTKLLRLHAEAGELLNDIQLGANPANEIIIYEIWSRVGNMAKTVSL